MILNKIKNIFSCKNNRFIYLIIILVTTLFLSIIFIFYKIKGGVLTNSNTLSKGEWIVVTVSNSENKSDLWLINTQNQTKQKLLNNKSVVVTGKVNTNGNTLLYSDAIGTNPWDIFKLNIESKEIYQITNDALGQFNLHFGDEKGNVIFTKSGGKSSPVPKISKIDINKKEAQTFSLGSDIGVQDFDVRNDKIIALTFSFDEFLTKRIKEKDDYSKIKYSIIEMDYYGNIVKELATISAVRIDSISFTRPGNSIVLGGEGILNNEKGFYKLDLKSNKIDVLLTQKELEKIGKISELSQPYIACLSSDEKNIYFTAIPEGANTKNIFGLTIYPNILYCYNFKEKKVSEIFKVQDTFIPLISFTYQ